jgi:hypothetical protein
MLGPVSRKMTKRQALGSGILCLGLSGAVIALTLLREASWSFDGVYAVVVLIPIGIHLVLKGGLGYDILADLRRLWRGAQPEDEPPADGD